MFWTNCLRVVIALVCLVSIVVMTISFIRHRNIWNQKTRDYWYGRLMWMVVGFSACIEGLVRDSPLRYTFIFTTAAALITLKGNLQRGSWGSNVLSSEVGEHDYLSPVLHELVKQVTYKPGWMIYIQHEISDDGSGGWLLCVVSNTTNSLIPTEKIRVRHGFLIPAASYNRDTWANWIFERLREVETHEAGEFFKVNSLREFAPHHGNGENPYIVWHTGDYATALKRAGDD